MEEPATRYHFLSDIDAQTVANLEKCTANNRAAISAVHLPMSVLAHNGTEYLHAVEAVRDYNARHAAIIRIRVITRQYRGVNVTIPCETEAMRQKYLTLRFLIRNTDFVLVTFQDLQVLGSVCERELFFKARDFALKPPDDDNDAVLS